MNRPIASETETLTFADFFRMDAEVQDVLRHFGVDFEERLLDLPRTTRPLERLGELTARLVDTMPHVALTSEAARREVLIAPILTEVVRYAGGRLRFEYSLRAGPQLQGSLDYLLEVRANIVIVEAKNEDMTRGFKQLAVELVAMDHAVGEEPGPAILYGAVSTGIVWQFGLLDRAAKRLTQDLNSWTIPTRLEDVLRILIGCVSPD